MALKKEKIGIFIIWGFGEERMIKGGKIQNSHKQDFENQKNGSL